MDHEEVAQLRAALAKRERDIAVLQEQLLASEEKAGQTLLEKQKLETDMRLLR